MKKLSSYYIMLGVMSMHLVAINSCKIGLHMQKGENNCNVVENDIMENTIQPQVPKDAKDENNCNIVLPTVTVKENTSVKDNVQDVEKNLSVGKTTMISNYSCKKMVLGGIGVGLYWVGNIMLITSYRVSEPESDLRLFYAIGGIVSLAGGRLVACSLEKE